MENTIPKGKAIKKGVIIKFDANSNIITKLYQVISFMSKSITTDQIEKYKKEMDSFLEISKGDKQFTEEWMTHITTLGLLIQQLEYAAEQQGLVYEIDMKDAVKNMEETIKSIIEDDSLLTDLSQLSPE